MFKIIRRSHSLICHQYIQKNLVLNVVNVVKVKKRTCLPVYHQKFCTEANAPQKPSLEENEEPDYEKLCQGDKDLEQKLKILVLEVEVLRQEGFQVPDNKYISDEHWLELLKLETRSSRKRFLTFLFKTAIKKENQKLKKQQKKMERPEKPPKKENETFEEFVSQYDLSHNTIFLRFHDKKINAFYNNRLIQAMMFGQKLVIDCGYDINMTKRENINCAKQLMLLFAENRAHDNPYDLHYCNANSESDLMKYLVRHIPSLYDSDFPLNVHSQSYLDIFPKNQLVYLTPHCRNEMLEFDHDAVYIIGAIVDKMNQEPLSLAKAKREGIKMAKFPLDRYLHWGAGSGKSLTLNQVVAILLDLKATGDWNFALRHVPKRKVLEYQPKQVKQVQPTWRPNRYNKNTDERPKQKRRTVSIFDE